MSLEERKESFLKELKELMTKHKASLEIDTSMELYSFKDSLYLILMPTEDSHCSGSFELGRIID